MTMTAKATTDRPPVMKSNYRWWRMPIASGLLFIATAAGACDLGYDEIAKAWRGVCKLSMDITRATLTTPELPIVRPTIRQPELSIEKFKYRLRGNQLEVFADIRNEGPADSVATTVVSNILVTDPANVNRMITTVFAPAAVPMLPAASTRRITLGTVTVDYSLHDVDVTLAAIVDPVLNARQPHGANWELIEANNLELDFCRVYGPNGNAAVGPCN
jgi:hypothetical protein